MNRVTGWLSLIAASLAAIAVLAQAYAYAAASAYYRSFNIEPTEVGLTPLNASIRLQETWLDFVAVALMVLTAAYALISATAYFHIMKSAPVAALVEPSHQSSSSKSSPALQSQKSSEVPKVASVKHLTVAGAAVVATIIFAIVSLIVITSVQHEARELADGITRPGTQFPGYTTLSADLGPPRVTVEWLDKNRVPTFFPPSSAPRGGAVIQGALIYSAADRYMVLTEAPGVPDQLHYLKSSDVVISYELY